ncbi:MAG: hypothetical protein KBA72_09155 [Thermoanaerobaculia bacterium]|nr:hypothetical protein [Thermoanaerobaculia bacterium]
MGIAISFGAALAVAAETTYGLQFAKLNRTYTDFVGELAPIGEEGLSVRLQSPKQAIVLRANRIRLTPIAGETGAFAGEVELDVQGKGDLIADVTIGPMVRNLTDVLVVPPQTIRLAAKVRIRRVADGYEVLPEKLPERIEVAVQSQTINQILTLCDQAATLSLGAVDCSGLDRSLTRPAVPIPGAGSFLLGNENLTDADRAALDALLGLPEPVKP